MGGLQVGAKPIGQPLHDALSNRAFRTLGDALAIRGSEMTVTIQKLRSINQMYC